MNALLAAALLLAAPVTAPETPRHEIGVGFGGGFSDDGGYLTLGASYGYQLTDWFTPRLRVAGTVSGERLSGRIDLSTTFFPWRGEDAAFMLVAGAGRLYTNYLGNATVVSAGPGVQFQLSGAAWGEAGLLYELTFFESGRETDRALVPILGISYRF